FDGMDLSDMYGFIEVLVRSPEGLNRPFLPYRSQSSNLLLFPTGEFKGVYFSEELKFAKKLGYKILPIRGYLFDRKPSPFRKFVNEVSDRRVKAKKVGDEGMSYCYKLIMNSLYGRFGINPECTNTEICTPERHAYLQSQADNSMNVIKLVRSDRIEIKRSNKKKKVVYVVSYVRNRKNLEEWIPPTISAVQLSAAITACSRIHMYPFISRDDCYYTDTDSVILGNPLPADHVSSTELGKWKLEHEITEGYFLAPKTYSFLTKDGKEITKQKGKAKNYVCYKWFANQYRDPSLVTKIKHEAEFDRNWKKLNIIKKVYDLKLQLNPESKRDVVYEQGKWIGTKPKHVFDYEVNDRYHLKLDVSVLEEDIEKLKNQKDPTLVIPLQKALDNIKAKLDDEIKGKGIKQELMPTEDEDPWLLRVSEEEMNERLLLIDVYEPWWLPEQESSCLIPTESKAQLLELPTIDQK
ncbi:hypothetical protein C3L33_23544, partial [Rhododendron williamsianum]